MDKNADAWCVYYMEVKERGENARPDKEFFVLSPFEGRVVKKGCIDSVFGDYYFCNKSKLVNCIRKFKKEDFDNNVPDGLNPRDEYEDKDRGVRVVVQRHFLEVGEEEEIRAILRGEYHLLEQ